MPLLEHLEDCGLDFLPPVSRCTEAYRILQDNPQVEVILTTIVLPDGTWSNLAAEAVRSHCKARTVMCMRISDPHLWIDVLEEGAFDVLLSPTSARRWGES